MSVREYIGARYVPIFADPIAWDSSRTYEPLTIVQHAGNSYTSRQYVPTGIDIGNNAYWALTGNYNAQIEQYRQEVQTFSGQIQDAKDDAENALDAATAASEAVADLAKEEGNKTAVQNSLMMGANTAPWRAMDAFCSFIPHVNRLHYGNESMLKYDYNETLDVFTPADLEGSYINGISTVGTSCAPTVIMAFMNIYYESSRLATGNFSTSAVPILSGGNNYPIGGGSSIDLLNKVIYEDYAQQSDHVTYASFFAKMLADAGMLHKRHNFDSVSEFHPGDVLFWSDADAAPNLFKNIHHTGIYIGAWSTGGMIADTSSPLHEEDSPQSRLYLMRNASLTTLANVRYYATIPCAASDSPIDLLEGNFPTSASPQGWEYRNVASADIAGHYLKLKSPLKPAHVYTALFQLKGLDGNKIESQNVRLGLGGRDISAGVTNQSLVVGNLNIANYASMLGNDYYCAVVRTDANFGTFNPTGFFFRPFTDSETLNMKITDVRLYDRLCQPSQQADVIF